MYGNVSVIFFELFQGATRGMTVVQELAAEKQAFLNITKFAISGGSKVTNKFVNLATNNNESTINYILTE